MLKTRLTYILIAFSLCAAGTLQAQIVWKDISPAPHWTQPSELQLSDFRSLSVQIDTLERQHLSAGMDSLSSFNFPMPDGSSLNFLIWLDPILASGLYSSYAFIPDFFGLLSRRSFSEAQTGYWSIWSAWPDHRSRGETYLDPATVSQRDVYVSYHQKFGAQRTNVLGS